jgi:hypothetical protein
MKTPEDEAFDELARKQGAWGGGFPAKRKAAADKLQEPIYNITVFDNAHPKGIPLEDWVQPPQRQWVGLTDDELADLWYKESLDWMEFARAYEAALKEKNNGT